ncbi:MAG: metallophosphoesterase [Deltaproteobacteria bacterium]|nr:metallophosphoesterase [Deltaproteobacteria bacterium]
MSPFRLAHFSDIHLTVSPFAQPLRLLAGKRAAGVVSYLAGGRRVRFRGVEERVRRLLEDIDALGVDHAICTGDLTSMSYPAEFERCAELFGPRLEAPQRWTVLPGNHDRYTAEALRDRRYEHHFASLVGSGFPFEKRLAERVTLIGLDVSRPTWFLDSSGRCGDEQLGAARALLSRGDLADHFVILALHYGPLREGGHPDRPTHGLRDWRQVLDLIDAPEVHLDLVLHGHVHEPYRLTRGRRTIACAGSATDLWHGGGYDVYTVDIARHSVTVERRGWEPSARSYRSLTSSAQA